MDSLPVWEGELLSPKEDGVLTGPSGGGIYVLDPTIYQEIERQDQWCNLVDIEGETRGEAKPNREKW